MRMNRDLLQSMQWGDLNVKNFKRKVDVREKNINNLLKQEEIMWSQRLIVNWLKRSHKNIANARKSCVGK